MEELNKRIQEVCDATHLAGILTNLVGLTPVPIHTLICFVQQRHLPVTVNALHPGPVNSSITRHFLGACNYLIDDTGSVPDD